MLHKGERNELCASLRRQDSFHKLFILSLLMSSPLRIEKKNMKCVSQQGSPHWCSADLNLRLLIFANFVMHRPPTGPQMRCPLLHIPLTLIINHNLFAWAPARCSGSLWAVCLSVRASPRVSPSSARTMDLWVLTASFYAKQPSTWGETVGKESQTRHKEEEFSGEVVTSAESMWLRQPSTDLCTFNFFR